MLSRRELLARGSIVSLAGAVPAQAVIARGPQITVFDSRFARSRMFAETRLGQYIDTAQNPVGLWTALREIPTKASVAGFTCWSDFIAIRGQLENASLRVRHVEQKGQLIHWAMD